VKSRSLLCSSLVLLGALIAFGSAFAKSQEATGGKTLLAIFAHPDDEITAAPLLARYAREGVTVKLAIVTDGQKGGQPPGPIGEALKVIRAAEALCSTDALGIDAPILMEFVDGDVGERVYEVKAAIGALLAKIQPDIVVTWGPDGGYGHKDHRIVGAIVSGLYQADVEGAPDAVYYPGIPLFQVDSFAPETGFGKRMKAIWGVTSEQYLQYRVAVSQDDITATYAAAACHSSQWDAATLKDINALVDAANQDVYLRRSHTEGGIRTGLFGNGH
jgi:LmbE family N-acetylglucosaminyl deacetylase